MTQKFILERFNRNTSEQELLEDLIRVSKELGRNQISTSEYNKLGKFTSVTYKNRFGSFILALEKARLSPLNNWNVSKEELINDLYLVIKETSNNKISKDEYVKKGKYSFEPFKRHFGTWSNAINEVGLTPRNYNVSYEDCFKNIEIIWVKLGRQPRYSEMKKPFSKYSGNLYVNKFGTWTKALGAFVENINSLVETENFIDVETNLESENKGKIIHTQRHKTKREIGWRLRFLVLRRDNFKCVSCGKSPATSEKTELHVDHIKSWDKFGETVIENLQSLCKECNIGKSNLDWKE